jgi:HEPN domain-containing protein
MLTQISFATLFELAPGMLALDQELDSLGCPIAYRKYFAEDWLTSVGDAPNVPRLIRKAAKLVARLDLCPAATARTWYNNVYGHDVYVVPASKLIAGVAPRPIVAIWDGGSKSALLPDITLIQYELEATLADALKPSSPLLAGLTAFQNVPSAPWAWLAMTDYDMSVMSFELPRPAYHLSLWHTYQCLEKFLKAGLLAQGDTVKDVTKHNHRLDFILSALLSHEISLTPRGEALAYEIQTLVGGPGTRYVDDSNDKKVRLNLAKRALRAHHALLEFFATDCATLVDCILSGAATPPGVVHSHHNHPSSDFRQLVQKEHSQLCSHAMFQVPPYAIPVEDTGS